MSLEVAPREGVALSARRSILHRPLLPKHPLQSIPGLQVIEATTCRQKPCAITRPWGEGLLRCAVRAACRGAQHRGCRQSGPCRRKRGATLDHPVIYFPRCHPVLAPSSSHLDSHETRGAVRPSSEGGGCGQKKEMPSPSVPRAEDEPSCPWPPPQRRPDPRLPAEKRRTRRGSLAPRPSWTRETPDARTNACGPTGRTADRSQPRVTQPEGRGDRRRGPGIRG